MTEHTGKVLLTTSTGFTLVATPLTLAARNALLLEGIRRFPDPDPAQYVKKVQRKTLDGDDSAEMDGRGSPEYQQALLLAKMSQRAYLETAVFDSCISLLDQSRVDVIAQFKDALDAMRGYSPNLPENDWEAVLKLFIADQIEINTLRDIISQKLPLTEEEVAEGRKFFRVRVQRDELRSVPAGKQSSGSAAAERDSDKQSDGGSGGGKGVGDRVRPGKRRS